MLDPVCSSIKCFLSKWDKINHNVETLHFFKIFFILNSEMATLGLQNDFVAGAVWAENIPLVSARPIHSFLLNSY